MTNNKTPGFYYVKTVSGEYFGSFDYLEDANKYSEKHPGSKVVTR
jgi:hypothetical protein